MKARTALLGSLLLHGGLLAAFGGGALWEPAGAPPRVPTLTAEIPAETLLEPDLPPLPLEAPEDSTLPPGMPDLPEPPPMGDPRFADEPPGPPAEIIGVSSIEGIRRGLLDGSGTGGAGRRGTGRGRGRAEPGPPPAVESPPPPEPVFLPPSLEADRAPVYPPAMRRAGVEGTVRVRVAVGADGSLGRVEVAESSGHGALDDAAVEAAKQWVFLPATEDGKPVASVVYRYVFFKLTDAR